jgi:DNA-binding transcriptional regulator YiaG
MTGAALARRLEVTPGAVGKWKREGPPLGRTGQLVAIFEAPPTSQEILEAIQHSGWSRSEFARRVGVSRALVRAWLGGVDVSGPRWEAVRRTIREAWSVEAPAVLSSREALLDLLDVHPGGVRRTELKGWRDHYKLDREDAGHQIDEAVKAGDAHWEQDFIDVGDHKRVVRRLVRGRKSESTEARLSGSDLKRLREEAELSRREAAELLGVRYPTYVNWENANIPNARVEDVRSILKEAASRTTPLDRKVREMVRVVSRHPDISRTELFESHVGDSKIAHRALDRALDDERVHERLVELVGRQPYRGLRVGPAFEPVDKSSLGGTLKERRVAAGLLQRELARAIGTSTPAISRWEKHGDSIPRRFHPLIEDALADAERGATARAAEKSETAMNRAFAAVIDGITRRPGISRKALLDRLSRPAVREALDRALEAGRVHEERRTITDRAGRSRISLGLYLGAGTEVGPLPDPIDPVEIRSVRRGAGLSQGEFAKLMGVSQATITGWERTTLVPVGRCEVLRTVMANLVSAPN